MLCLGIAFDQLWADNVADSVSNKYSCCHNCLLCGASNIASSNCDDQTDHWAKETGQCITNHWCDRVISPLGFPDHHTASNHRQAAGDKHRYARIRDNGRDVATKRNEDDTNATNWELE